jgi:hypothetical protein
MKNLQFIIGGIHIISIAFHNFGLRGKAISRLQDWSNFTDTSHGGSMMHFFIRIVGVGTGSTRHVGQ